MSITETGEYIEQASGAALTAAAAVVRCLPAADLSPGGPEIGPNGLQSALVGAGSKAVTANIAGATSGTIVLVLSAELAAQVENGPIGPQELVAGLEPALTDATAALGGALGELRYEAAQALDAEVALSNGASFDNIIVIPINAEGTPAAAFVLLTSNPVAEEAPAASAAFEPLSGAIATGAVRAVELLNDVEMGVTAELGRTRMTVRELLSMQPGSIVELDRAAGSPVDLLVNGTLVARGEVVVIDEEFGVRITEIIGYDQKKNG